MQTADVARLAKTLSLALCMASRSNTPRTHAQRSRWSRFRMLVVKASLQTRSLE